MTTSPRLFHLQRDHDISGVSGTGRVANGVQWPDGTVTLRWIGDRPSTVHWDRLGDAVAIHGHSGATRIVWADEQPPADQTAVLARIRQMTDHWEQHLPEVIRTPAVVSALRAAMEPAAGAQQDEVWPVKESTRRYAEELRATPGQASADGHTGWECDAGASLLVAASTPGPGKLGTHHGTIYACTRHRDAAVERITGAGYEVDPQPAPPGHRWNSWPCGHVTAHDAEALTALTAADEPQDGARP